MKGRVLKMEGITRRTALGASALIGAGSLLASLFPEVAVAATATKASQAKREKAIRLAKSNKDVSRALAQYTGYDLHWDDKGVVIAGGFALVSVIAVNKPGRQFVHLRATLELDTSQCLFVQHTMIVGPDSGTHLADVKVSFDGETPVWVGRLNEQSRYVPDVGYVDIPSSALQLRAVAGGVHFKKSAKQKCLDTVGDVCNLAAGGDAILACALLVETVAGAIACGAALLIIQFFGCKKLQSMIC